MNSAMVSMVLGSAIWAIVPGSGPLAHPVGLELQPHHQAVANLKVLGAEVREKEGCQGRRYITVSISQQWNGRGEDLRWLKDLRDLRSVHLWNVDIQDADLAHVAVLNDLEQLSIRASGVTDSGVHHLSGLVKLKRLTLMNTHVTVEGIRQLEGLADVRYIALDIPNPKAMREELKSIFPRAAQAGDL